MIPFSWNSPSEEPAVLSRQAESKQEVVRPQSQEKGSLGPSQQGQPGPAPASGLQPVSNSETPPECCWGCWPSSPSRSQPAWAWPTPGFHLPEARQLLLWLTPHSQLVWGQRVSGKELAGEGLALGPQPGLGRSQAPQKRVGGRPSLCA